MSDSQATKTNHEEGQGLLEFTLIFFLLVMVIFATIDFARLFFSYATISNAAREGARYGIVHPGDPSDPSDPRNQAIIGTAESKMVVIGGTSSVQLTYPDGCADPTCPIRVSITANMDVMTPILPSVTLASTSTMHIE